MPAKEKSARKILLPRDAALAQEMSKRLLAKGVCVIGFSFPVVPKGLARIRTQVSAAHTHQDLDFAVEKFPEVSKELKLPCAPEP